MTPILKYVLARFEEPSTWAGGGVAAVLASAFFHPSTEVLNAGLQLGSALAALLAVVLPEKRNA